jgi:hypothetical protein
VTCFAAAAGRVIISGYETVTFADQAGGDLAEMVAGQRWIRIFPGISWKIDAHHEG